ncbi:nuclear pore complex protein Nup50 [Drosophila montana]|uniref:nuclear pore complex protein Nup50 n=1 Tax=Drosophila montana TaxID=40370 RepID=UPI00313D56F4
MAGKRQATSNLNHDNWDQEDEPEERGTFRTAPPEELKARVIKKATRRKATIGAADADDAGDSPGRSVFSGFSGFGKPAAAAAAGTPFAFLSNLPAAAATAKFAESSPKPSTSISTAKDDVAITPPPAKRLTVEANIKNDLTSNSLSSTSTTRPVATTSIFGNTSANDAATTFPKTPVSMFKSAVPAEKTTAGNAITASLEYRDNVAELNMAVMKFLQEHMDKNPYCLLSPVFDSYDKYAKELRQKDEAKSNATSSLTKTPSPTTKAETTTAITTTAVVAPTTTAVTPKLPTITPAAATVTTAAPATGFFFGKPTTTTATETTSPSLSFGKKPNCTITSGGSTTTVTAPLFSFGNIQKPSTTPTKSEATSSTASPASIFSFGIKPATAASNKADSPKQGFFFGGQEAAAAAPATSPPKTNGFSFGLKSDDKPSTSVFTGFGKPAGETKLPAPSSGFSFTSGATPFSFGNVKPPTASESAETNADNEDEDRPPVVEFNKVVEDDAIFSKRCKVFVKKDKDFVDRGVGTLYLKPVKDTKKTQMLVRADTNLGNILVNLILTDGLPCQRMGKNNVMMVCIPTPEEPKALSMLLRVKTGEEADELLEQIKKHTV